MPIYNIIKEGEAKHNKTIKNKPNVDAFGNAIANKDFDEKRMKNILGTNVTQRTFGDKYVDTLSVSMNSDDLLQQMIEISPEIIDKSKLELVAAAEDTVKAFEDYMYNLIFLTNQDLKPVGNELNLTELISVIKAEEAYKFARKGQRTIIFDTICKEDTNYEDFDIELNQFFEKPKVKVHK